ncbi:hypothetical protein K438DRAFT_5029 [Mycena galopus ATCC 62051]|nr:hypothetical protein K438DRAFT_5029 [Mycena galopus ATCC 62051]
MASTAFASQAQHKPHIRQEGFHLPSPPPSSDTPPPPSNIFGMSHGGNGGYGDFNDELVASLINPQSNERSTQSPDNSDYRPPPHTHNIFDISAPHSQSHHHVHHGSASSTSSSFPSHFSLNNNNNNGNGNGSGASTGSPGADGGQSPQVPYHFNSTLPALNSSMRYDPHPPPASAGGNNSNYMPSPSSFRSPSPHHASRSRSRSRPPSSHMPAAPSNAGGPTRTTRTRRNGSLSSTSPPPRPVPQAIVIPSGHGNNAGARGSPYANQGWFGVNGWVHFPCLAFPSFWFLVFLLERFFDWMRFDLFALCALRDFGLVWPPA